MTAFDRIITALEAHGSTMKMVGRDQASAQCPAHDDGSPSLSVTGIEGQALIHCHAGCAIVDVLAALELGMADLFDTRRGADYRYDNGRTVHRTVDKQFPQSGTDNAPELYRLARVRAAVAEGRPVYVAEGEKDVHALEAEGVTATCSPMGAGKWSKVDPSPLYGAHVLVIADQDDPGRKHAEDVYCSLAGRADVAILAPKVGKDAADHIAAGRGVEEFVRVAVEQDKPSGPVVPVLHPDALHGLPGAVVDGVMPHTEADPAAVLLTFLAAAGAMIGRSAHLLAGDAEHPAKVWPLIIGKTAGGSKGTSWAAIRRIVAAADPSFTDKIERGLSSGEGLIERVRDSDGEPDDKTFIEGVADKRLLIVESEFAAVLGKSKREGNVLSETLRDAWDGDRLSTMTRKSSRLIATGTHIVVVGHITPTELRAKLSESDVAGGLMNRFLPVHSQRSKRMPDGGTTPREIVDALAVRLRGAVEYAGSVREIHRDDAATALWRSVYAELTPDLPDGHLASVVARAAPQVLRLSLLYALLDTDTTTQAIRVEHLQAALAVWRYVEASARLTFGDLEASRELSKLAAAIDAAGTDGLTRSDVVDLFDRHLPRAALDELLRRLIGTGRYVEGTVQTGGRPATRYTRTSVRDKREKRAKPAPEAPTPAADPVTSHNSLISQPLDELRTCPECGKLTTPSATGHASLCLDCTVADLAAPSLTSPHIAER